MGWFDIPEILIAVMLFGALMWAGYNWTHRTGHH